MSNINVELQQAYYGEVNRAHGCISQTINDSNLKSQLLSFTDRPAALPPGIELEPYYSGMLISQYFVFTKTFANPNATRAGMVFTHVLIINQKDIGLIDNLNDIFSYFIDSIPMELVELSSINITISENCSLNDKSQPIFVQEAIYSLLNGVSPILFSGNIDSFKLILQQIWNTPIIELRKKIKFRVSFSPYDIEGREDITIVSIPNELLQKWSTHNIIQAKNTQLVDITCFSESLFFGKKDDNPFYNFMVELKLDQSIFSNFSKFKKVFEVYISIDTINDGNVIRQHIRQLSLFSPFSTDGKEIKDKFLVRFEELIDSGLETNLKALRNINWNAFNDGEKKVKKMLSDFIKKEFNTKNKIQLIIEILELSVTDTTKNWWHNTIKETITTMLETTNLSIMIDSFWKMIDISDTIIDNFFELISCTKDNELLLVNSIPNNLQKKTCKSIELISKQRNWYILHSESLLRNMNLESAIRQQLDLENKLIVENSIGVLYICKRLNDNQLVKLTLFIQDNKLIHILVERIINNKKILSDLNVKEPCWLIIWSLVLTKNEKFFEDTEQKIIYEILDLIIKNIEVPEIIILLISNSHYADISDYQNRRVFWTNISSKFIDLFLNKTAYSILKKYLLDEIKIESIEEPLIEAIKSYKCISNYLNIHINNIEKVIKIYESFSNLNEILLSNYIDKYTQNITEIESIRLGNLVNKLNFKNTAISIYKKSKQYKSFITASKICKDINNLSFKEKILNSNKNKQKNEEPLMIETLPTVVVLTAIQEEYEAVRKHLKEIKDVDNNDTSYEQGIFELDQMNIANVIIRECGARNTISAQETERAILNFNPDSLFFVGIAGSRKPNDFKVGDVIFPEKIYSYEGGKSEKEAFKVRPDLSNPTYTLLELAKKERRKDDWKRLIKNNYEFEVKANLGIIASGEQVVEDYNSSVGQILTNHFNDTSVIEMEGYGFLKIANRQGRNTSNMLVGIVRGISDIIGQPHENISEVKTDKRPDRVKELASDTAAAFAFWLIFKTYEKKD